MPRQATTVLACSVCGQSFIGDPDDSVATGFHFCSEGCSDAFWEEQKRRYDEEINDTKKALEEKIDA